MSKIIEVVFTDDYDTPLVAAGSFNGRTSEFEFENEGSSIPSPAASDPIFAAIAAIHASRRRLPVDWPGECK